MGRAKALTCAVLLLLATACGEGDSDRAETVSTPPSDPTPTATASPDAAAKDSESDAEPADAEAVLLTVEDMPTGWSTDPSDDGDDGPDDGANLCDQDPVDEFEPASEATANFAAGNMGPFLEHIVAVFDDGQAEQALDMMLDALESCDEWTEDTEDGTTTYRPSPLSFPTFGDQTVAVRIDVESEMVNGTADMIAWRRGDALSVVIASAIFEAPDAEQIEKIVATADERLNEVD